MNCLIAVVGPTAVGKSRLGSFIAGSFPVEIVNADSRQIYRYMDIGTAKPSAEERAYIPHHLIDIIMPDQNYSVAQYKQDATEAMNIIKSRGKLPLLIGGSGQYIWSLIEGWQIPEVPPDLQFREAMALKEAEKGGGYIYAELEKIDAASASRIGSTNKRRIIRALEIFRKTGKKPSELQKKIGIEYPVLIIGLILERENLYKLIDTRVEKMISDGFINEVEGLIRMGYNPALPSMSSLGYREITDYLNKKIGLQEAIERIKFETHRFARSQYAWFRTNDERIKWFYSSDDNRSEIIYTIKTFLKNLRDKHDQNN